jgi:hypothetical protein
MIDVWMGDDFFHNGAFRQTYGYDYVLEMETSKESTDVDYGKARTESRAMGTTTSSNAAASARM